MNIKELEEYLIVEKRYIVYFGAFAYELFIDEEDGKKSIYVSSWNGFHDLIDVNKQFRNTDSAIKYIKKELREVFKYALEDMKKRDKTNAR